MYEPKPGVCGLCGCAVMRSPREPKTGERNGHIFREGKLMRARCSRHGGGTFEARPGSDELQGSWEDSCVDRRCL